MDGTQSLITEWESRFDLPWDTFWETLSAPWQRALAGTASAAAPDAASILRRRRLTTDLEWVGYLQPMTCLPAVREALLWDENGMDLGPLTQTYEGHIRSWDRLLLGGPACVDLGQLSGVPVRHLVLSVVDVATFDMLSDVPGLKSLTLDLYGESVSLPPLPDLTDLTLYSGTHVDGDTVRVNPDLRILSSDEEFCPPFGPDDVAR
ncbi:hypothetical protein [Nocardia gipuzkoensis]|uniref:hypothetical protein n=1 Tax=Nocardia gipuzkoensis TaxID=2749991 RepID=UPI003EDEADFC